MDVHNKKEKVYGSTFKCAKANEMEKIKTWIDHLPRDRLGLPFCTTIHFLQQNFSTTNQFGQVICLTILMECLIKR